MSKNSQHGSSEQIQYPKEDFMYRTFRNAQDLKTALNTNNYGIFYKLKKLGKNVIANCTQCKSKITIGVQNSRLQISQFESMHFHKQNEIEVIAQPSRGNSDTFDKKNLKSKTDHEEKIKARAQQDQSEEKTKINEQRKQVEIAQNMEMQEEWQDLSSSSIKNLCDPNANFTLKQFVEQLQKKSVAVSVLYQNEKSSIPEIFLSISPLMRNNYKIFGQSINFQVHPLTVEGQFNTLAIFSGFDTNLRRVIFGYGYLRTFAPALIEELVYEFIKTMDKSPQSIITKFDQNINEAIYELKRKGFYIGVHILDSFQILHKLRQELEDSDCEIFELFAKALTTQSEHVFKESVDKLYHKCVSFRQKQILQQFICRSNYICFSKLPEKFVGLNFSTFQEQTLGEILKSTIKQNKFVEVANFFSNYQILHLQSTPQFQQIPFEKYFNNPNLQELRKKMQKNAFKKLIESYYQRSDYQIISTEPNRYRVKIHKSNKSRNQYEITYNGRAYICSCGITIKTGIPCAHLIRLLQLRRINLKDAVNTRWIYQKPVKKSKIDDENQDIFSDAILRF